jgi:hypothetical protein
MTWLALVLAEFGGRKLRGDKELSMATIQFPICGPRKPVYDALRGRGFVASGWSDKWWKRHDGIEACVYGAGSRLMIRKGTEQLFDGPMADVLADLDRMKN